MIKKDIKYIIKRVITAVLIVLILGSLKQCKVHADNLQNAYINNFGYNVEDITSTSWQQNAPIVYSFNISNYKLNIVNNSNNYFYYALFQDNNNNFYMFTSNSFNLGNTFTFNNINFTTNAIEYKTNDTISFSSDSGVFFSIRCFSSNNFSTSSVITDFVNDYNMTLKYNQLYDNNIYQNIYYFGANSNTSSNMTNILNYLNNNLTFVSSSVPFYINSNEIVVPPADPLEEYTRIDLTGYQALLAVPNNYPYLASEYGYVNDNNEDYIHYTFGYENCINPVLINMSNLENWYSFSDWNDNSNDNYCGSTPTLMSLDYPLQNEDNYNYMGILIYNNSLLYDTNSNDWVNNQQNPYGTSYVYINEEYYDYYLINDYNSFNQTLDFTDFDGETTTLYISTLPTFTDLAGQVFSQQDIDDNLSTRQKIDKLLSFGKLPFDFFKRTITAECKPLKAPFPHGNFDIELPCLSSSFESFMGSALYGVVRLIINGLLVYRITMSLIVFTTKKLDPKDCSIEVGALL